jgi:hypothetical protein
MVYVLVPYVQIYMYCSYNTKSLFGCSDLANLANFFKLQTRLSKLTELPVNVTNNVTLVLIYQSCLQPDFHLNTSVYVVGPLWPRKRRNLPKPMTCREKIPLHLVPGG